MKLTPRLLLLVTGLWSTQTCLTAANDASIDKLLGKLPAPEKLVRQRVEHAVKQSDNALKDPVAKQALAEYSSRDFLAALNHARELVKRNPHSATAHFLHGVVAFDVNQLSEAAGAFRSSIACESNHAIVHLSLGATEMLRKHFATAMSSLEETGRLEKSWAIGWVLASQCAIELGHSQEGLDLATRATATEPAWIVTWLQLARAHRAAGQRQETLDTMIKAVELAPDSGEMYAAIGFSYINLNHIPQAIPPLQRAAKLLPRDYLVQSQLGFCLQQTGDVDMGISLLRKGISLKSSYGPAWEHLGLAYQRKADHKHAVEAFEKATQLMPSSRNPWQHLADEYRALGRPADADRAAARAQQFSRASSKSEKKT